ncbi:MAG TPA: YidC/Oxa1 family membrane protein insertase [Candidatus Paceibacterota bacterium]|jgi:membrane protein insertase, YidC/Oxa1 family, C-terminal domain
MHYLYTHIIFLPLYNGLVFLSGHIPYLGAGGVIILFTVIVRLILFPLSRKAARTQALMRQIEPELASVKERFKDDKQQQALETMKIYKEKDVNPFSSILLLIIQIPIIFALYRVFYSVGFSAPDSTLLYSFVHAPATLDTIFLGVIDITKKSAILAVLAALSQYLQIRFAVPKPAPKTGKGGFQEDFAHTMHMQMKYVFPVMILFIAWNVAGALALYWITSNLFMIAQELVVRKQMAREAAVKAA